MAESYIMEHPPRAPEELSEYLAREFRRIELAMNGLDLNYESRWQTLFNSANTLSRPASGAATVGNILSASSGVQVMWFSSSSEQSLYGAVQLPPQYKTGSWVYPEVTWLHEATATAGATVIWRLEYSMAERSGTFSAATRLAITATAAAPFAHLSAELPAITASSIGTQILFRLYRNAADTLDQSAGATAIIFHYEADTHGSIYRNIKG